MVKKRILYIEDESYNRVLLRKILEPKSYEVIEAEDGLIGIEKARTEDVDLILLDINMEGMNGFEIATRIKSISKCADIPLVALTANVLGKSKERALISGCDGFLTKPINTHNILDKLEQYIAGKKDFIPPEKIPELLKEHSVELVNHLEKEIKELKLVNEELKQIDKIKSDFISIASHELRTPLVTIIGYIGLLISNRLGEIPPEIMKILTIVERNSKRLERVVKDMFTLSLIEKKIPFMQVNSANIPEMVKSIIEDYNLVLEERNLTANYHEFGEIPNIECDKHQINQVISNVFNNSIKYTENGGTIDVITIYPARKITNKYGLVPEKYLEIIIKDNGIGIPEDKLDRIFKKFVELSEIEKHHSSDTEFMGGGAGLGLSISKAIISKHNGFIWAENRKQKGTKMYIVIPLVIENREHFKNSNFPNTFY